MRIKTGDIVKVLTGDDKGVTGKVLRVDHEKNKVVVEGVNRVYKHVRRTQRNPQGGRLSKEMPVSVSNVALVCQRCTKPARLGLRYTDEGAKERYCKRCSAALGAVAPPHPQYAAK